MTLTSSLVRFRSSSPSWGRHSFR